MKLKAIALLLMFTTLTTMLISCGGAAQPQNTDAQTEAVTDAETSVESMLNMDFNYDGQEINTLIATIPDRTPDDFDYNESRADVMDEAKYERNKVMFEKYGVRMSSTKDIGMNHKGYETIQQDYTSGDNVYQLCVLRGYDAAKLAILGALYDFKAMPNVNTANSWWDQSAERDLSIAGSLFFTTGAISTVIDDFTFCVVFNKDLYKATIGNSINVYDLVKEGKWTIDKLEELSKGMKDDVNGDDIMDTRDRYGLMIWDDEMMASINASGHKIASINKEGLVEMTLLNDTVNTVVEKFVTIANSDYCINFQQTKEGGKQFYDIFTEDHALFFMSMFNEVERFRNMRTDYGILPNPKLTEDAPYYSPISPWHSAFICVPSTIENEDDISNIVELMGYHSEKLITPAYYDKTLIGKYTRDDESVDMLDIIFKNRMYDVGNLYTVGNIQEQVTNLLRNNQPGGLSAMYQSYSGPALAEIKELNLKITMLKNKQG